MTLAWMFYCLLVSLLLGWAALAAERGLSLYRRPVRWLWLGSMAGSFTLPALMYVFPVAHPMMREPLLPAIEVYAGAEGLATAPALPGGGSPLLSATIDDLLLAFWALASAMVFVFLLRSYLQLRRERRHWLPGAIGTSEVFVSRRLGPAVTGLFRSWIVIPAWALELDEELRSLILLHEEEHLRAGDHRLLLAALAALTIMPWNLPLWWQFRRLRVALELDCDRRVLGQGIDTRAYGELLIEVGRRAANPSFLPAAFAEPRSFLEERVRTMIRTVPKDRRRKSAIATTLAALLTVLAFAAPSPVTGDGPPSKSSPATQAPPGVPAVQDTAQPPFTPYTVGPQFKNPQAAVAVLESHYPDSLRAARVGGTAVVWVFIDEKGAVRDARLRESSRIHALDQAALAAAFKFEFTPARNEDEVVPVWIAIPINFSATPSRGSQPPPEAVAPQDTFQPHFTPYTTQPDLKDRNGAIAEVQRHYPDSLKAAGVGGTAVVWVFIDEEGVVRNVRLKESSGNDALNQAALAAASSIEFTPALNEDQVVPVWVAIPITFSTLSGGPTETAKFRLRAILRMIAAFQEKQYQDTGEYHRSLDAILEQAMQVREQGMKAIVPAEDEVVLFEAQPDAWAAVVQSGELECAMYYGDITAPRDYAEHGKAVCK